MCVTKEGEVSYILWTEAKYYFVKHQKSVFSSFFEYAETGLFQTFLVVISMDTSCNDSCGL